MKRITSCAGILCIVLGLFCTPVAPRAQSDSKVPQLAQGEDLAKDARVKWLKRNAVGVRSVDPKDEDFRDLMPLKKVLGNVRIVMLGESTHGDGATFLGKTRLIKFLHQEMGFDVLAFESGLYDMSKVWESFRQGDHSLASIQQGVVGAWGGSDQVAPLFDYVAGSARTQRPLELAGFDLVTGPASRDHLVKDLVAFLTEIGVNTDLLLEGSSFRTILEEVLTLKYFRGTPVPSPAEQDAYFRRLEQLEKDITARSAGKDNLRIGFWIQELHSLRGASEAVWLFQLKEKAPMARLGMERDKQMAENLFWLANERYRGRKIIVWAATAHLIRNRGFGKDQCADPKDFDYCNRIPMGQRVWESLGRQIYVLGFTAYGGTAGNIRNGKVDEWVGPIKQDQRPSIEMEELLNASGFSYAFLNFRSPHKGGDWLKTPIWSRTMGNQAGLRDWTQALDGLFFIREQQPNTQ